MVRKKQPMTPTHYTLYEGGVWLNWDKGPLKEDWELKQRADKYVCINGCGVHSLAFDNPAKGRNKFPRWDCINGWTAKFGT